jgi:hypothetical protein
MVQGVSIGYIISSVVSGFVMDYILTEAPQAKNFMDWIMTGFTFSLVSNLSMSLALARLYLRLCVVLRESAWCWCCGLAGHGDREVFDAVRRLHQRRCDCNHRCIRAAAGARPHQPLSGAGR